MQIDWQETRNSDGQLECLSYKETSGQKSLQQSAVDLAVERAVQLISLNIADDSRYFVCEWSEQQSLLKINVSDESKGSDSPVSLELTLSGDATEPDAELIRFWITDFLSSCSDFLRFSLIAVFHTGDPSRSQLL